MPAVPGRQRDGEARHAGGVPSARREVMANGRRYGTIRHAPRPRGGAWLTPVRTGAPSSARRRTEGAPPAQRFGPERRRTSSGRAVNVLQLGRRIHGRDRPTAGASQSPCPAGAVHTRFERHAEHRLALSRGAGAGLAQGWRSRAWSRNCFASSTAICRARGISRGAGKSSTRPSSWCRATTTRTRKTRRSNPARCPRCSATSLMGSRDIAGG